MTTKKKADNVKSKPSKDVLTLFAADRDEMIELQDELRELYGVLHLVVCALDVARQREAISEIDNLMIHPLCDTVGGLNKGSEALLGYASDSLAWVLKYLEEKDVYTGALGATEESVLCSAKRIVKKSTA